MRSVAPLGVDARDWPQVEALLDEALGLPRPEREAWLEALPADRATWRATLERLLDADARASSLDFLGTLPPLPPLPDRAEPPGPKPPSVGDRVGPWTLRRELGHGGMGMVWLAERADGLLKRAVALKLPRMSWAPGLAERLARERDILATLTHPHIARLYDAGVDAAERPWLALEHVQGEPIDAHCRVHRLGLPARVALLLQVAEAVSYAHGRLVIHRDLKPSNILVTDDGQVRLLDFGIARLLEADGSAGPSTALAPMTPGYASPEQLQALPLGTASDVYALGVVAHELLCGRRPHDDVPATAAAQLQAVLASDLPVPSTRPMDATGAAERCTTPAAWRKALAGDLDAVLLRALARDPAQRYATVQAFADDLMRWRDGRAVGAQRPTPGYLLRRFVRRHRWAVAAGGTAVVALVATALVAVVLGLQAREQAARAQATRDFLIGLYDRADPDLRSGRDASARELLAEGEADVAHLPPGLQAEMLQMVVQLWLRFGDPVRAARAQAHLSTLRQSQGDALGLALSRAEEGRIAVLDERWSDAQRVLGEAEAAAPLRIWPADVRAQAHETRGWADLNSDRAAQALDHFRAAEAATPQARHAAAAERRLRAWQGQAAALTLLGRGDEARAARRAVLGAADADTELPLRVRVDTLTGLSADLFMAGRYAEGAPVAERALALGKTLYGSDAAAQIRPREWWLRYRLALGEAAAAAAWLRAHPLTEAQLRGTGEMTPVYWSLVTARVWAAMGEPAAAQAAVAAAERAAAALGAAAKASIGPVIAMTRAVADIAQGRGQQALTVLAEVGARDAGRREWLMAVALAALGRPGEAAERLQQGLAQTIDPSEPPAIVALWRLDLAIVLLRADPLAHLSAVQALLRAALPMLADTHGAAAPPTRLAARLNGVLAGNGASTVALRQALADTGAMAATFRLFH